MAAIVVPLGCLSRARTASCLVPLRVEPEGMIPGFAGLNRPRSDRENTGRKSQRMANEATFRADPELVAKALDRLAEATMRLAEATHLERLARPGDFAAWAAAERKRCGMVRLYARALFAVECIPAELRIDGDPSAKRPPHTVRVLYVRT